MNKGERPMKIIEAINKIDALKPNNYTQEDKIGWLSTLDGLIKNEIIDTHENKDNITFAGYTAETSTDTELLVPAPYEDVYIKWLEAQIDYANGEIGKYNNGMTMFNSAYSAFERYYNRNNMPLAKGFRYFG